MKQVKQVLKELMISSILWTAIVTLLFVIISRGRVSMLFGGLFGGAAALVLLWHMFRHLDIALVMTGACIQTCAACITAEIGDHGGYAGGMHDIL